MKLGRLKNDTKWNYGIEIRRTPYMLDGFEINLWLFKQRIARETEGYMISEDKVGFFFTSVFGYTGRIISFRVPRIRAKFF